MQFFFCLFEWTLYCKHIVTITAVADWQINIVMSDCHKLFLNWHMIRFEMCHMDYNNTIVKVVFLVIFMPFICWQTENIIISVTTQTNDLLHTSIKLFIFLPDYNPMGHKCHHVLHHLIISRLLVPTWRFLMSLQMLETQQILLEVRVRKMRSKGRVIWYMMLGNSCVISFSVVEIWSHFLSLSILSWKPFPMYNLCKIVLKFMHVSNLYTRILPYRNLKKWMPNNCL